MKLALMFLLFLTGCSSLRTDEEIQLYAKGFFHGCIYVEERKDFNLTGLADCAAKEQQLLEYYRRTGMKKE
jgi:hypothetical protein